MSEETMKSVDREVRAIIDQQYALARRLLEENREKVEVMAKALLEWETIDADQIHDIMGGKPPRPPKPVQPKTPPPPPADSGTRGTEPTPAPQESA
jgi:cell division protease FtsH